MKKVIQIDNTNPKGLGEMLKEPLKEIIKEEFKNFIQSMKKNISDEYLTRKETAEFLRISETTLWSLDKSQKLPAKRLNGKVLYLKSDLLNFFEETA
jgi:predicted DNA-binding transcriptional regulator AlpA